MESELIEALLHRFRNRADTYCLQQSDGHYRRVYASLGIDLVQRHLAGELTLALDGLGRDGHTRWLCFDSDVAGVEQLQRVWQEVRAFGLGAQLEASRRGGHLWVCWSTPQPAAAVRRIAQVACERAGVTMEVYPNANHTATVAQPVRLPFGVHQRTGQRYPLLDMAGRPLCAAEDVTAGVSWLVGQQLNTTRHLQEVLAAFPPVASPVPATRPGQSVAIAAEEETPRTAGGRYGAVAWARQQPLPRLIDATKPGVSLRRAGRGYLGWCPFHDDAAPQEDGSAGTPSLYVYCDVVHGWRWRCFSSNCGAAQGQVKDQFDWLVWCAAGSTRRALELADQLREERVGG